MALIVSSYDYVYRREYGLEILKLGLENSTGMECLTYAILAWVPPLFEKKQGVRKPSRAVIHYNKDVSRLKHVFVQPQVSIHCVVWNSVVGLLVT
jgi:hypothetical protein